MPSPVLKLNKLFNVYNTTLRMLQDRGCTILGPKPVVEALAANPTGANPVSLAVLKKLCRPDSEDASQNGLAINRAGLTITCTLSSYVLQLSSSSSSSSSSTDAPSSSSSAPLMQVAFVEEESTNLSMNTVNQLRDAARSAGAQWLTVVADAKISSAVHKECGELNVGWSLLSTASAARNNNNHNNAVAAAAAAATGSCSTTTTSSNGIISDVVERNAGSLEIPAGAQPRRSKKSSDKKKSGDDNPTAAAAAPTTATNDNNNNNAVAAVLSAFADENQPLAAFVAKKKDDDDDDEKDGSDSDDDNAKKKDKKKKNKSEKQQQIRPLFVELFEEDELVFSPFRHSLAPKHRVLAPAEVDQLLKEKGATLSQLPRILYSDPVSRYYGLMRGAVLHVLRAPVNDVVGEYVMYRHVV